nr:hypothetical protein [Tanacetum cinerariifolium]
MSPPPMLGVEGDEQGHGNDALGLPGSQSPEYDLDLNNLEKVLEINLVTFPNVANAVLQIKSSMCMLSASVWYGVSFWTTEKEIRRAKALKEDEGIGTFRSTKANSTHSVVKSLEMMT